MVKDLSIIGTRLRQLRSETGLTQAEVAKDCGVYQNTVSKFEQTGEGSLSVLFTILDFYQQKLHPKKFDILADTFTISDEPVTPMTEIILERLQAFKSESTSTLDEIMEQLKASGLQQF